MNAYPPTPNFRITQPFADPGKYATRADSHGPAGHHSGTDYGRLLAWATMLGRRVDSCTPGEVVISEHNSTMGNWVGVYYAADDVTITYWHLASRKVKVGDRVTRGQQLGRVGSTGNSTGPHIHIQANHGRGFDYHAHIDPAPWVATTPGVPSDTSAREVTMKFVSRAEWGARPSRGPSAIGSTLGVSLHWEGPHMGDFPHSECAGKVRGIQRFHMDDRGWSDIAYNAIPCPHGYVFEGRGVGVMSAANGWQQVNDDWYAVCYLGGERDPFTDAGKAAMVDAVQWLRRAGNAGPRVNGHRDHKATACPGDEIHRWLQAADFDAQTSTPESEEDDMPSPAEFWNHQIEDLSQRLANGKYKTRKAQRVLSEAAFRALGARQASFANTEVLKRLVREVAGLDDKIRADLLEALESVDLTVEPPEDADPN